jgi:hypothetical protein
MIIVWGVHCYSCWLVQSALGTTCKRTCTCPPNASYSERKWHARLLNHNCFELSHGPAFKVVTKCSIRLCELNLVVKDIIQSQSSFGPYVNLQTLGQPFNIFSLISHYRNLTWITFLMFYHWGAISISVRKSSNVIYMQAGLMGLESVHIGNIGKAFSDSSICFAGCNIAHLAWLRMFNRITIGLVY